MISETFITLISLTRRETIMGLAEQMQYQVSTFRNHIIGGALIIILGACFLLLPDLTFSGLTGLVIPAIVFIAAISTLVSGISVKSLQIKNPDDIVRGLLLIIISFVLFVIPAIFWGTCILIIISIWMFASSVILLKRIIHGKKAVPEGFVSRLLIGTGSLVLGVFSFLSPTSVFYLFLDILGVLTMILGGVITLIGIRLRELMRPTLSG
jgi:hypothetical protein